MPSPAVKSERRLEGIVGRRLHLHRFRRGEQPQWPRSSPEPPRPLRPLRSLRPIRGQHRLDLERRLRTMPGGRPEPDQVAGSEPDREALPQPLPVGPGRGVERLRRRRGKIEAGHSAGRVERLGAFPKEIEPAPGITESPPRPDFDPPPSGARGIEAEDQDHLPRPEISAAEPGAQPLQQCGAGRFDRCRVPQGLHPLPVDPKRRAGRAHPQRLGPASIRLEHSIETPKQPLAEPFGESRSGTAREVADTPQPDPAQPRRAPGIEAKGLHRELVHLVRGSDGEVRAREAGESPGRTGRARHRRPNGPPASGEHAAAVFQHGPLAAKEMGGPRHVDQEIIRPPDDPGPVSFGGPRRRLHRSGFTFAVPRARQQGRTPCAGVGPSHSGAHSRGFRRLRYRRHHRAAMHDRRYRSPAVPVRPGLALRRQSGKPHAKHPSHRSTPPTTHAASPGAPAGAPTATAALFPVPARESSPSRFPPSPCRAPGPGTRSRALPRTRPRAAAGDRARSAAPRPSRLPPRRAPAREAPFPPPRAPPSRCPSGPSPGGAGPGRGRRTPGDEEAKRIHLRPRTTGPARAGGRTAPPRTR